MWQDMKVLKEESWRQKSKSIYKSKRYVILNFISKFELIIETIKVNQPWQDCPKQKKNL